MYCICILGIWGHLQLHVAGRVLLQGLPITFLEYRQVSSLSRSSMKGSSLIGAISMFPRFSLRNFLFLGAGGGAASLSSSSNSPSHDRSSRMICLIDLSKSMTAYSTSMISLLQVYAGEGGVELPVEAIADIDICFDCTRLNTPLCIPCPRDI